MKLVLSLLGQQIISFATRIEQQLNAVIDTKLYVSVTLST